MQKYFASFAIVIAFVFSCQHPSTPSSNSAILKQKDLKRIVLVGGTLISGMEEHALFELAMLQYYAGQEISFRNIGWPADDVFGLARSQFGSAQNTRSWQPPTAEEGFGSKVLMEHIDEATPSTLMVGYGSEMAFAETEEDFTLFKSGYNRLLDYVESKNIRLILLAPPRHEKTFATQETYETHNQWLAKARDFIQQQAEARDHTFVDLYENLITNSEEQLYTENGLQLNRTGYKKMSLILLEKLGIPHYQNFSIQIDKDAHITGTENCEYSNWVETVNGVSFDLSPDQMLYQGKVHSKEPIAIFINGKLSPKSQDTLSNIILEKDSLETYQLVETIKEKNRLYRYRLRPLNEAYIYLFRRHEMGHLAYEMDDLLKLVEEKEKEIQQLISEQSYFVEIELIKPWAPPRNYPEDEVPAFIPEPNIEKELEAFNIADGYEISLFAADPMIANPININWDTKGRAWVATSSTYPHIVPGREPNDKIIILEDTDGDGKADKHTVFAENLLIPHSVMPVPGGAYVTASTELLFLADTDGDDVADERRVVYDGFGNADVHHMIHGLRWMPWGDLHFTQSIYINSFIETPYGSRVLNGSGIWSFRPETEKLDIFSRGLINPWGEAIDKWGQTFATDGAGSSGMNYLFPESAHATAVGAPKVLPGLNNNTPKNTAAEFIYSRHFPTDWQGTVITNDFRANRTVRYQLTPDQSGYQSKEIQTVLRSDHRSYRPVDTKIGPDGAIYIVDWYNPIIDHGEVDFHHPIRDRKHGRVWKLTRKESPLLKQVNFHKATFSQLLDLLKSSEQFTRIQANRAYVEKAGDPQLVVNWMKKQTGLSRVEGLWLLAALNHYDKDILATSLSSRILQERAAAIRMVGHWKKQEAFKDKLATLVNDPHPQVRLESLHALREMGGLEAAEMATKVMDAPMDENITFALELTLRSTKEAWLSAFTDGKRVFRGDKNKQLFALLTSEDKRIISPVKTLLEEGKIEKDLETRAWLVMAKIGDSETRTLVLEKAKGEEKVEFLRAMANAPDAYDAVPNDLSALAALLSNQNQGLRLEAMKLVGRWKADQYEQLLVEKVDEASDMGERTAALRALVKMGKEEKLKTFTGASQTLENQTAAHIVWIEENPKDAAMSAVKLLSTLEHPDYAEAIFIAFRRLENGPSILTEALNGKKLTEEIANVGLRVAQSSGLNLKDLDEAIRKAGNIQPVGIEMTRTEKDELIRDALENGNQYRGRNIYRRKELLCATCHRINGIGGLTGPDLTTVGSYMVPNSILESILNPSNDIKQNYETVLVTRTNGEVVSGLLHRKTNTSTLIRQANGNIVEIPSEEISKVDVSPVSLMPPGLTSNLTKDELKDLMAYLISLGKEN